MKIVKCGSRVTSKIGNITGIITAISIRFLNVNYEVSYFHEGKKQECWLNEQEFKMADGDRQIIGFKKQDI